MAETAPVAAMHANHPTPSTHYSRMPETPPASCLQSTKSLPRGGQGLAPLEFWLNTTAHVPGRPELSAQNGREAATAPRARGGARRRGLWLAYERDHLIVSFICTVRFQWDGTPAKAPKYSRSVACMGSHEGRSESDVHGFACWGS